MTKELMKISDAQFGTVPDMPFLIGMRLQFAGQSSAVGDGGKFCLNIKNIAEGQTEKIFGHINDTLKEAGVNSIEQLKGKPVEVTFNGGMFSHFRILKEVL